MTVTEGTTAGPAAGRVGDDQDVLTARRVLLVWDAPNLDMGLGAILGRRPTGAERPRFDALGRWLLNRTAEVSASHPETSIKPEATVFTNIAPGSADVVRPWVEALRNVGFAVFAKPKVDDDTDVDADMLVISRCAATRDWPHWWWPRPTGRLSANRWKSCPVSASRFKCSDFANMPAGR